MPKCGTCISYVHVHSEVGNTCAELLMKMLLFFKIHSKPCTYVLLFYYYTIQHAADERIRLEELRRKVVNITVAKKKIILLFHTHMVIVQVLSEEGHVVTYLDSEEELVRHV